MSEQVFNSKRFFNNVTHLAKARGMKIGELEVKAKVSVGYMARAKEGKNNPSIEFIINAANILEVSIDSLLHTDLIMPNRTEEYYKSFLKKMVSETKNDNLDWRVEPIEWLNNLEADENENSPHELFRFRRKTFKDNSADGDEFFFNSQTFKEETRIDGDCYWIKIKNEIRIYVMHVGTIVKHTNDKHQSNIEFWIVDWEVKECICTSADNNQLSVLVDELYREIKKSTSRPRVNSHFRYSIDCFLRGDDGSSDSKRKLYTFKNISDDGD